MKYAFLLASLMLFGCGVEGTVETVETADEKDRETVFDPYVNALDKANNVEDQVLQHKEDMDKRLREMEEAEQGSD